MKTVKQSLSRGVASIAANDRIWSLLEHTLLQVTRRLEFERMMIRRLRGEAADEADFRRVCPDSVVQRGAFAGMRYPTLRSLGSSTIFPKLLGTYEDELAGIIEQICQTDYSEVIDVGCGEGYYAVGLALRIPGAKVYAYDTDPNARLSCERMAELNGVSDRVVIDSFCSADTLARLPIRKRALVIADCEGYERHLFTPSSAAALASHDLLIEVHDFIDVTISDHLRLVFEATHNIETVQSLDDIRKARACGVPTLQALPIEIRLRLMREQRPAGMEWFVLRPKSDEATRVRPRLDEAAGYATSSAQDAGAQIPAGRRRP